MEDRIPGLGEALSVRRMSYRGADVQNAEDTTVDQPCANTKKRLAVNSWEHKVDSPQNPDRPLRPHSNLGPSKGEGKDDRTKAQK